MFPGPSPRERFERLGRSFSSFCTSTETGVFLVLGGTSWNGKAQADLMSWTDRHLPPPSRCPAERVLCFRHPETDLNEDNHDSMEREKALSPVENRDLK
ncbi:hypothetical protein NDU88_000020 [Pleurodeles waltl]|uniref:Uncharacterized protein n=1 Tax=Pleurodeles waltl TaxID=8319 RepID=A0AAV7MFN6_PLEWA|nr:hypothetical protein NDU88_000020 [Pleurodeles waltl]